MASTSPEPSQPSPPPPPSKSSKPPRPYPHILDLLPLPLYISKTSLTLTHLNRLLSTTSHLDTTLLTTTYTLHLLHSLLTRLPSTSTPHISKIHHPINRISRLTTALPPLTALLDETRLILRLWGLLGIYTWAVSTLHTPPKQPITKAITWGQIAACAIFQALENGAFLAERGVLGWSGEKKAWAWSWSARAWMVHVALELLRLGKDYRDFGERHVSRVETTEVEGEKGTDIEETALALANEEEQHAARRREKFYNDLTVNVAYAPMTVHYSFDQMGLLGEGALGLLGCIVGWSSIGRAWRESA